MATKPLKSITFPNLPDIYTVPQIDDTLLEQGKAADSKAVGDAIGDLTDHLSQRLDTSENSINAITQQITTFADELEVDEEGLVWLLNNGERIAGPYGPFAGGGGGGSGSGNNAVLTATNTTGWLSKTIAEGATCELSFTWSSLEDELPTGDGSLTVRVGGAVKSVTNISQGNNVVDVSSYLGAGSNSVRLTISDVYGNTRSINFTINVISLSISSSFDSSMVREGSFSFPYTPVGNVEKTVYFIIDGEPEDPFTTTSSNRQLSYTIPAQSHGAHSLRVYFEATVNGEVVRSNELNYEFISVVQGTTDTIISIQYTQTTVAQFATINIPFKVYNPAALTAEVEIYINGEVYSTQTVDRTEQIFSYRAAETGTLLVAITSGNASRAISLTVTESEVDAEAETENLVLYLTSQGRSNNEENPGVWTYNDISATFNGFNWASDGWTLDEEGSTVLRLTGDARVTIPYQMFKTDFRSAGKTIEVDFSTSDVRDYDASVLSCMSGNRGISLTAQKAVLKSEQSEISMQYKEDEHIRVSFVVQKRSENRLLMIYINGILSGTVQYPTDDDFSQPTPVNISIGSSYCTTDIYCIRVYDNDLTRTQILDNWIADTQNGELMYDRYVHNNVYDAYGNIVISKLPADLPYMIITAPQLPQSKGDKKTVEVSYVDPMVSSRSFTATNVQADVQGTSSQYYARKNYKLKFKGGFTKPNGETAAKYQLRSDSIPTNTFTMKADVASSEGANNVELARLYNNICPYKTPAQEENPNIRQGIDGYPIVIFWNNGTDTQFMGKYNFNNDKGTEEVFGFTDGDESWEIKNNTSNRVIWKSDDYVGSGWLNDFEARYPDIEPPYEDPTQLAEFAAWLKSTDRSQATGDTLPAPVTYNVKVVEVVEKVDEETGAITYEEVETMQDVTFDKDTADYRLAKFKDEASKYMELESAIFYYMFTELFLMVDSRAKNAFPSFIGGAYE